MISTTLFLTAGLMASPVIIQDVKASREAGHLRVEVAGDGGIDPDGARTKIDDGLLLIYLTGARVRADNRSWSLADGAGAIRAHRHRYETELVVPLAGNGCTGPVEFQGTETGITALVGCDGAVGSKGGGGAEVRKSKVGKGQELKALVELPAAEARLAVKPQEPKPEAKQEAKQEPKQEAKQEAKVDAKAETKAVPKVAAKLDHEVAAGTAEPAASALTSAGSRAAAPAGVKVPTATELLAPATGAPATTSTTGGGLRSIGLPATLLGLLALGAYLFARRRRNVQVRHIQILETASLGPKRSLVVAKVGTETLILGTSEAGITLLKGAAAETPAAAAETPVAAPASATVLADTATTKLSELENVVMARIADEAAQAEARAAAFEIEQPLEEALADIPEPGPGGMVPRAPFRAIDGGLGGLGGLGAAFTGRRIEPVLGGDDGAADDERIPFATRPPARREERADERLSLRDRLRGTDRAEARFEELLEDSLEDQELRQKLAAGMSARVR